MVLGLMARSDPPRTLTSETISLARQQSHQPTHFGYIAAPGDNFEALVLAVQPCGVLLASPARLHWAWVGAADWHSNSAGWSSIGDASGHSRQSVVAVFAGLISPVSIQAVFRDLFAHTKIGKGWRYPSHHRHGVPSRMHCIHLVGAF